MADAKTRTNKKDAKKKEKRQLGSIDWALLSVVVALLAIGLVMVFSASYAQSLAGYGSPYRFIMRQLMWTVVGVVALVAAARIDYGWWERLSIFLMAGALLLLMAVVTVGNETFGAQRFFFGGSVQPSEAAKVIIIIYASAWLASKGQRVRDVRVGLLPFGVLMGIIAVLIVMQPNISTAVLIVATAMIMFFIAGAKLNQLLFLVAIGTLTFAMVINYSSYAQGRVDRYLASIQNPLLSEEWQTANATQAMINGGPLGVGVGNSTAKLPGYLPLSWSDNIFAVIGEELGLIGTLLIVLLFAVLAYRGLRIALNAPDNFGMLLATGITSLLTLQAVLNASVVLAVAPPTGVTLPFISYGGSSLVMAMGSVGILLNISRYSDVMARMRSAPGNVAYARFNFGWGNRRTRLPRTRSSRTTQTSAGKRTSGRTGGSRSTAGGRTSRSTGSRSSGSRSSGTRSRATGRS